MPVDGVVGENGGLWFWFDGQKLQRRFVQDAKTRVENREKTKSSFLILYYKRCRGQLASDQPYRDLDFTIDFCEDVPALPNEDVEKIAQCFRDHGATCKISSIHVNGWYGDFDKLRGFRQFHIDRWGEEADLSEWERFLIQRMTSRCLRPPSIGLLASQTSKTSWIESSILRNGLLLLKEVRVL